MKYLLILCMIGISANLYAQSERIKVQVEKRNSITIGIMQGGGALVGADVELLLTKRIGIQAGAGWVGFGGGINYHFAPSIRSSFISLQYWNQGVGKSFAQNVIGPNFVYRARKWFTCQLGVGVPLEKGPALPKDYVQPEALLMYAIGAYLPF